MANYYSFTNGLEIDNATINEWLRTARETLLNGESYDYTASGDSFVVGTRYESDGVNHYEFRVYTNRGYMKIGTFRGDKALMEHKFRFYREDLV